MTDSGREKLKKANWQVHLRRRSNYRAFMKIYSFLVVIYASLSNAAELVGSNAIE